MAIYYGWMRGQVAKLPPWADSLFRRGGRFRFNYVRMTVFYKCGSSDLHAHRNSSCYNSDGSVFTR